MMLDYIRDNWDQILLVVLAVHVLARRIVDMTPTTQDNKVLDAIESAVRLVAVKPKV